MKILKSIISHLTSSAKYHHALPLGVCIGLGALLCCTVIYANEKAVYYRYYDQNRSVNISKSVTQQHIRYGYQTLDRNMQVISNVPPYNFHDDLKQENVRAAQSQQIKNDQLIKRSYRNAAYATEKKNQTLTNLTKHIAKYDDYLQQLYSKQSQLEQQKQVLLQQKKPIPINLQQQLDQNLNTLKHTQTNQNILKAQYQQQQQHYDEIIQRLNTLK